MPKIIENIPEKLSAEAKRLVLENGYTAMNIRAVAKNCGVGVGTVYNYFPSKDALIASFLIEEWQACLGRIHAAGQAEPGLHSALHAMHEELHGFLERYMDLFRDSDVSAPPRQYHIILRSQLARILRPQCPDDFTADFMAEALLTWTVEGKPFPEIYGVLKKVI